MMRGHALLERGALDSEQMWVGENKTAYLVELVYSLQNLALLVGRD